MTNILPPDFEEGGRKPLSEEQLLAYLDGKLSQEDMREVEHWLAREGMESDALEGLSGMGAIATKDSVKRLNRKLNKTLKNKKRQRRKLISDQFTWVAITVILLLAVVAYIVVRRSI